MPALSHNGNGEHRRALKLLVSHCLKELSHKIREEITAFTDEKHLEEVLDLFPHIFLASAVEATQEIRNEREKRRSVIINDQARPEEEG